jgi:DNA-directed RNA polymerase subunit RPC12/RpoP
VDVPTLILVGWHSETCPRLNIYTNVHFVLLTAARREINMSKNRNEREQAILQQIMQEKIAALPHESEFQDYACPECSCRLMISAVRTKFLSKFNPLNTFEEDTDMPLRVLACIKCHKEIWIEGPNANAVLVNAEKRITTIN